MCELRYKSVWRPKRFGFKGLSFLPAYCIIIDRKNHNLCQFHFKHNLIFISLYVHILRPFTGKRHGAVGRKNFETGGEDDDRSSLFYTLFDKVQYFLWSHGASVRPIYPVSIVLCFSISARRFPKNTAHPKTTTAELHIIT